MTYKLVQGNILTSEAEAIIISVDGDHPKMIGSIGRRLQELIDDERTWSDIITAARFPIGAGDVRVVSLEDADVPFAFAIFVSMFNHLNNRTEVAQGYYNALAAASNWKFRTVATALHTGGWRGSKAASEGALATACLRVPEVAVTLYRL